MSALQLHRLGWLANSSNLDPRRGSNLLAVYYSIQDAKALVRYLNLTQLGAGNPYGINASNTIMVGQGSGDISPLHTTIDSIQKLQDQLNSSIRILLVLWSASIARRDPYVDTVL